MASHDDVVKAVRAVPEYASGLQGRLRPRGHHRRRGGRHRHLRTDRGLRQLAPSTASWPGTRPRCPESAQRGWELWNGKARCNTCHPFGGATPNFSDNKFHNIGVAAKGRDFAALARQAAAGRDPQKLAFHPDFSELGRFVTTKQPKDIGAFKTTGLRDIALSAPYMHDGSEATLLDVVKFYDKGGEPNPYLDGGIVPLKLTEQEMKDLVAFMESLTGEGDGSPTRSGAARPREVRRLVYEEGPFREVPRGPRRLLRPGLPPGPPRLPQGRRPRGRGRRGHGQDPAPLLPARGRGARRCAREVLPLRLHLRQPPLREVAERALRAGHPEGGGRRQRHEPRPRFRALRRRPRPARPGRASSARGRRS